MLFLDSIAAALPTLVSSFIILFIAFMCSSHQRLITLRPLVIGLAMHHCIAFFFFRTSYGDLFCRSAIRGMHVLQQAVEAGGAFFFGNLAYSSGEWGIVLLLQMLPMVIFFSVLTAILYFFRIMQYVVWACSRMIQPLLGITGVESFGTIANIFLTSIEVPLLIRYYLSQLTSSEIFVVMVAGQATLSAAFLPVHKILGVDPLFLFAANCMSVPASIIVSKIMVPESEVSLLGPNIIRDIRTVHYRVTDAIRESAESGLVMIGKALALLSGIIGIVALINFLTGWFFGITLEQAFLPLFSGMAYLIGIDSGDLSSAGIVLGKRFFIHELVAFKYMMTLSILPLTKKILTVALAGFASMPSVILFTGVYSYLAPNKADVLARLAPRAMLAGPLVTFLNAIVIQLYW